MPTARNTNNNRDHIVRDEFLLETNFDDDGAETRAYNNLNNNNNNELSVGLNRHRGYQSDVSLDRYTESNYGGNKRGDCCRSCMTRIPYATLIATIMCLIGVGIFCGTMYRGTSLTIIMFDQVFRQRLLWIEAVQMIFVVIGASMAALGFMILFVGFLATGATRYKVYRAWRSRVGGRISCAVFMAITYILNIVWILILCFLAIITFIFTVFWNMCSYNDDTKGSCIDLSQFHFMFPSTIRPEEDLKICEKFQIKAFCKDGVEKIEIMFILATVSCLLIVLSLVHYLMCLAANYAHIRDHEKFQELQEMQNLADLNDYSTASKERF